jgi:hypothetical protein
MGTRTTCTSVHVHGLVNFDVHVCVTINLVTILAVVTNICTDTLLWKTCFEVITTGHKKTHSHITSHNGFHETSPISLHPPLAFVPPGSPGGGGGTNRTQAHSRVLAQCLIPELVVTLNTYNWQPVCFAKFLSARSLSPPRLPPCLGTPLSTND